MEVDEQKIKEAVREHVRAAVVAACDPYDPNGLVVEAEAAIDAIISWLANALARIAKLEEREAERDARAEGRAAAARDLADARGTR